MHTISLRIPVKIWQEQSLFAQLLTLLREQRQVISEVAFFTALTHPPLPLATIQVEAEQLGQVCIPAVRALGLRAGINHLATLGHLDDENPENSLHEPWQHLVDISGAESSSCYCAADPRMQEYIQQSYRALATAAPDFIWMDDDVRLEHHPPVIRYACFCPRCLANFARESGVAWTRETLYAQFHSGARAERLALRRQWLAHTHGYTTRLFALIRTAVDAVNPRLPLGLMTGEIAYHTYNFTRWVAAMAGPQAWR